MKFLLRLAALVAVLLITGAGAALADAPMRLAGPVTDRAGVLGTAGSASVEDAVARLKQEKGYDLFVVYVRSFSGTPAASWADRTADLSDLGRTDVLLAVAVDDRAYHVSYAQDFPLSQSQTDRIGESAVEPKLAANDWAGAATALADGLRGGGGSGSGSGPGPATIAVVGGAAVVGGGAYLLVRRRRRSAAAPGPAPTPTAAPPDEFAGVTTDDLAYRASQALLDADDAVRSSEQELSAARGHFGDAAVARFAAALEESRADMLRGFTLRQQLDDDQPEDEPTKRRMLAEIVSACRAADERLDAQVAAFDGLRNLEATAPAYVEQLAARLTEAQARLPRAGEAWEGLARRWAASALAPVAGNLDQAGRLLGAAAGELDAARAMLAGAGPTVVADAGAGNGAAGPVPGSTGSGGPGDGGSGVNGSGAGGSGDGGSSANGSGAGSGRPEGAGSDAGTVEQPHGAATPNAAAVVSGRAAEDAITQAGTLLDAVDRLDGELTAAGEKIAAAKAETEQDLAEARTLVTPDDTTGLAALVARAEAALASAAEAQAASPPDPMAALRLVDEADQALDQGIGAARDAAATRRRATAALEQTLLTARSAVGAAEDFIQTRRGAVGTLARTRLEEAKRRLAAAEANTDPAAATAQAQSADALAREAQRAAQSDVDGFMRQSPGGGGGLGELGGLVLGGIVSGAFSGGGGHRGGGGFGGGGGGFGGGFGGGSPGGFGGSGSQGRRGGGGRF